MKLSKQVSKEDRHMLNRIFWRSFFGQASRAGGQTRQHAIGFLYSIMPALDRYYKDDKKGKTAALVRHTQFFNVTSNLSTLVMGIVAAMERENSLDEKFDANSIVAVKVALMGPLSGIGDSVFLGVLRVIAAGVGINLALQGSVLGPVLFFLIYNIPSTIIRYYLTYIGFTSGSDFLTSVSKTGSMEVITKGASILGLIMVGAMTAATVTFKTVVEFPIKGSDPVLLQTYLDSIFKGLVPISLTILCKHLLDKKVNVNIVMLVVVLLAIVLALLKIV